MNKRLITIREAAEFLDVSIDTLRRWDKSGKLIAARKPNGTHRYYTKADLLMVSNDISALAEKWAVLNKAIPEEVYCQSSLVFQLRLSTMQEALKRSGVSDNNVSLLVAVAGEIGNNSFDHNLGNWPDIPGVFFGYDVRSKIIVLADRGQGILTTLRRVRPQLDSHSEALRVAFTEGVSGRAPEKRGNGLKFVRKVTVEHGMQLVFRTGDAQAVIDQEADSLHISVSKTYVQGCLALLTYSIHP